MDKVQQEVDKLYKEHFGRLVACLLYSFKDIDLETTEDIVQDSFSSALTEWRLKEMPLNPVGWINTVCKHKALNKIKHSKYTEAFSETTTLQSVDITFSESILDDQHLKLLFACAHPDLSPKVQAVITLKYVVNLKVEAIAKNLGMTVDGVDKLLLRARQKIKNENLLLQEPEISALNLRLKSVHKVIYLIFNEGYKSSWGKEILREDLCEEALILNKALLDSQLGNQETAALHALMLFNSARFKSRFGLSGEIIDLENQDRTRWNADFISLAETYLHQSKSETVSAYHLEASIAWLHCAAKSFGTTDWVMITKLYARLLHDNPNPFVELNYAIALYYSGQKLHSFQILNQLLRHAFLNRYYLLNCVLGKFYYLEGNYTQAKQFLLKALHQATFKLEKDFIQKMIDQLRVNEKL